MDNYTYTKHKHNLLSIIKTQFSSEKYINKLLSRHRIFISTVDVIEREVKELDMVNFNAIIVEHDVQNALKVIGDKLFNHDRLVIAGTHS